MIVRHAFKTLFKVLAAAFLGYCIVTSIRVWAGEHSQASQLPQDNGWVLLWCSLGLSILRRWVGPIGWRAWDLVHEVLLLAIHISTGIGMPRSGSPTPPPSQEGE